MDNRIHILNVIGMEYTPGSVITTHSHDDYYQIYYICSGTPTYFYKNGSVSLKKGDILFVPPHTDHGLLPVIGEKLVVLDFKFEINDNEFKKELRLHNLEMKSNSPEVQSIFDIMFTVAQKKKVYYLDILGNLLTSVLYLYISESATDNEKESFDMPRYNNLSECTKKVLWYIEGAVLNSYDRSLDVIAENVGYNKTYMSRNFSEEIGMSITKYLQLLRLDKAKELLLTTDYDINHICRLLNFNDSTHFIRTFKSYFDTTPEKFRKSATKDEGFLRYSFRFNGISEPPEQSPKDKNV